MKTIAISVFALSLVAVAFASVKTIKHSPASKVNDPIIIIVDGEGSPGAPASPDDVEHLRCLLDPCCTIFHKKVPKKQ